MKKSLLWFLIMVLAVSMIATFSLAGCKKEEVVETTAAVTTAAVTTAVATTAAETTAAEEYNPGEKEVYYVSFQLGHPSIRTALLGLLIKSEELGYNLKVAGPITNDHAATIAALEQIIAQKPDAIITWINNPDYFPVLELAAEAGIPVGDIHTLSFMDLNKPVGITYAVGGNQFNMAGTMADALAKKIGSKGVIGTSCDEFVNPNHQLIISSFIEYVGKNYPDIEVLDDIESGTEGATAESISRVVAYILANPEMKAAFGLTGNASEIWAAAFDETGRDDIAFMGMDYTLVNLDFIKSGQIYGVMAQPLYDEGMEGIVLMDKVLRGEEVQFYNELPIPALTGDDMDLVNKWYEIVSTAEAKVTGYLEKAYQK